MNWIAKCIITGVGSVSAFFENIISGGSYATERDELISDTLEILDQQYDWSEVDIRDKAVALEIIGQKLSILYNFIGRDYFICGYDEILHLYLNTQLQEEVVKVEEIRVGMETSYITPFSELDIEALLETDKLDNVPSLLQDDLEDA